MMCAVRLKSLPRPFTLTNRKEYVMTATNFPNNVQDLQKLGQTNMDNTMKAAAEWQKNVPTNLQDMQKLGQVNVEGTMKAVTEWQKGMQTIATELTNYTKRSFEDSTQTFEKLMSVKSLDQVFEIQSSYAKRAYEEYMQQMNKIGGLYTNFAKEAYKPVTNALQQTR